MPRPRPPFLHCLEESRHGRVAWYVRRGGGRRIRLKPNTAPGFWAGVPRRPGGRAARGEGREATHARVGARTISRQLGVGRAIECHAAATREHLPAGGRAETASGGSPVTFCCARSRPRLFGCPRARRAATPHAANNFIKSMRAFFAWAIENKWSRSIRLVASSYCMA